MRDAFGGTFMFKLIIIFIVLYVSFATIAVSYAKTFRLKNGVIDILEQYQFNYTGSNERAWNVVHDYVDPYLDKASYHARNSMSVNHCTSQGGRMSSNGACILPIEYTMNQTNHYYYRVTLYMVIKIPGINYNAVIPVSGETKDFGREYKINPQG